MKKNVFLGLLVILLAFCLTVVGCDNGSTNNQGNNTTPTHTHEWGEWIVTKEPTLSEEGVETRTCRADSSHTETRIIPKIFSSVNSLIAYLSAQPDNDTNTPYTVFINIDDLTGFNVAIRNSGKYINLNLSGSTFTSIEFNSFFNNDFLIRVTLPNSVNIEHSVFGRSANLLEINVADDHPNNRSINGVLYNKDITRLIVFPSGVTGTFTVPTTVTSLSGFQATSLSTLNIHENVDTISLQTLSISTTLTVINIAPSNPNYTSANGLILNKDGTTLIMAAGGLSTVTIPNGVTTIGRDAFNSSSLTSINIPNNVTIIEMQAFVGCINLTSITLPANLTTIGLMAFQSTGLTSITIPASVNFLHNNAFRSVNNLSSVTFMGTISAENFAVTTNVSETMANQVFPGDLRDKFYEIDPINGTPGTYTTTRNAGDFITAVWTKVN